MPPKKAAPKATPSEGPRRIEPKAEESTDQRLTITVDGRTYTVDGFPSHKHERALYDQAERLTFAKISAALMEPGFVPPFVIAGVVFLARLQAGDPLPYDEIAESIDYNTPTAWGAPEDGDGPGEAQGSDTGP